MAGAGSHPIILFDGVCNLCNASVNWIIARDPRGQFRFAALQSPAGEALQHRYGLDPVALDTLILIDRGRVHRRSAGLLRIVRRLRWPWPVLFVLVAVPPVVRDSVYSFVARRRYRWFGRRERCTTPAPEVRGRYLDDF